MCAGVPPQPRKFPRLCAPTMRCSPRRRRRRRRRRERCGGGGGFFGSFVVSALRLLSAFRRALSAALRSALNYTSRHHRPAQLRALLHCRQLGAKICKRAFLLSPKKPPLSYQPPPPLLPPPPPPPPPAGATQHCGRAQTGEFARLGGDPSAHLNGRQTQKKSVKNGHLRVVPD